MAEPDLLCGIKEIAAHLNRTPKQVAHWANKDLIPTFKMGGTVCSTRSGLAKHFARQMEISGQIGVMLG